MKAIVTLPDGKKVEHKSDGILVLRIEKDFLIVGRLTGKTIEVIERYQPGRWSKAIVRGRRGT